MNDLFNNNIKRLLNIYLNENFGQYEIKVWDMNLLSSDSHKQYIENDGCYDREEIRCYITEKDDVDELIETLPYPYNKKDIGDKIKIGNVIMENQRYPYNDNQDVIFKMHITVELYLDLDNVKFTTKKGKYFEKLINDKSCVRERLNFKDDENVRSLTSKTGLNESFKNITGIIAKHSTKLSEQLDDNETKTEIFNDDYNAQDYNADLYTMSVDYIEDYKYINSLYSNQIDKLLLGPCFKNPHYMLNIFEYIQSIYYAKLLETIDLDKVKALIGYILENRPDNITFIDLFESNIPNNLITSNYMPDLKFEKVII